ncbi:MAG: hypothetical protein GFH27_549379n29 [Chloroflexi bacterium AL-W]|nr:hypothetical protein [Chloroflexi bacterium AL-N1]NOK71153.1 hypothetical protein [Chloroflexi bacterium AL-N10]NOK78619.1 hypothetical protein [Chloroflexi bacterium AL-N5]NOK85915.1 hypothetical protein [Chloroflexi bacterium AL-W]NOK92890.1 hypothetical protein [Chloroflexi bacterium AL-N15]
MSRFIWPIIILLSAIGAGVVVFQDMSTPIRPILAFWFVLVCPGMALVRLLGLREWVVELMLGIALSISLTTIVAMVTLYIGNWSPPLVLGVLIGISLVGILLQPLTTRLRSAPDASS